MGDKLDKIKKVGNILAEPAKWSEGKGILPVASGFFGRLLSFVAKWIFGVAIVIILVIALIFGWRLFIGAGVAGVGVEHVGVGIEQTVPGIVNSLGLGNVYLLLTNPEKSLTSYGFESDIQNNANNKDLGVKIEKLETHTKAYFSHEPIQLLGTIKAQALDEDMNVKVTCNLNGYGENSKVDAEISASTASGNTAKLFKGQIDVIQATCDYPNGLVAEKALDVAKGTMYVDYNFKTKALHKTYFLDRNTLNKMKAVGVDPFEELNIDEPLLNKEDNTMRSIATDGPINLGIGTFQSQPFAEGQPYIFGVSINNNFGWGGDLSRIERLEVHVPGFISLEGDSRYGTLTTNSFCAFEETGARDEEGLNIYVLKQKYLDKVNKDCRGTTINTLLTEEKCIEFFKRSLDYRCKFKVLETPQGRMPHDFIFASVEYEYETAAHTVVDLRKLPEEVVNA